jgi:uncharacterized membrane protein
MAKHKAENREPGPVNHRAERAIYTGITPHTETGLERIIFFSDAVIAIAITLLALEIRLPNATITSDQLPSALLALTPIYGSFLISFFVIGLFWMSHHRVFEYIHAYDRQLIWINLIFLFLVAFVPFPTAVLGRFPGERVSVVFYAAVMVGLSLVRIWFWWYAYYGAKLTRPDTSPHAGRYEFYRAISTAGVFGLSIIIAFWNPAWAMYTWFLLIPATLFARSPS